MTATRLPNCLADGCDTLPRVRHGLLSMSTSIAAVCAVGEGARRRGASARRLAVALVLTAIVADIDYLTGYDDPFDSL